MKNKGEKKEYQRGLKSYLVVNKHIVKKDMNLPLKIQESTKVVSTAKNALGVDAESLCEKREVGKLAKMLEEGYK